MSSIARTETYAEWLSRELDERGYSVRSFSKKWNATDPETARRQLRRYLNGQVPIERTRTEIASHLGTSETGPKSDDDAEGD